MKTTVYTLIFTLLWGSMSLLHAQSTSVEKKVEINDDGKNPKVTIVTTVNGKTTKEVLTGDEARAYIKEHADGSESQASANAGANGAKSSSSTVKLNINSEDFDKLEQELEALGVSISNEVTKLAQDVEQINIDSVLESVGIQIEQSFNEFRYEFTTGDDDEKSIIIMKSSEENDGTANEQKEVDVEVTRSGNDVQKTVTVKKRTIIVEDDNTYKASKSPRIDDLHFFPNPASNNVTIAFENEKDDPVTVEIADVTGKPYHTSTVSGEGSKTLTIDVSDLNAGNYLIRLVQGERTLVKRLVIQ